jgi:hypothetical protein
MIENRAVFASEKEMADLNSSVGSLIGPQG